MSHPVRLQTVRRPDALHRAQRDAARFAIARPVQCVVSPGGSVRVSATTWSTSADGKGGSPGFLVLSCSRPATPSCMNRSCQRHTQGFDTRRGDDLRRAAAFRRRQNDPRPPHMLLLAVAGPPTTAASRSRSATLTSISIPSRIAHYCTPRANREFLPLMSIMSTANTA